MYEEFYGLTSSPFKLTPDPRFFFAGGPHKKALAYVAYGMSKCEGFLVITGDVGAGKTTLIDYLLQTVSPEQVNTAKIVTTRLDSDSLLSMVTRAFGIETQNSDRASLLHGLQEHLLAVHRRGSRSLLIIDEVQNLTRDVLEDLRMLSNFQQGAEPLLQVFLVGQPEFRQTLASPVLEQLRQRVIAYYHLHPLGPLETRNYIRHRLKQAGWNGSPQFTLKALDQLYRETGGVPRRINVLCDRLLLFGFLEQKRIFGQAEVQATINDMRDENSYVQPTGDRGLAAGGVTPLEVQDGGSHRQQAPQGGDIVVDTPMSQSRNRG
jgi:putative secretion ATPase (PEP-CTERM system associated)